jgi:hypothetical protein
MPAAQREDAASTYRQAGAKREGFSEAGEVSLRKAYKAASNRTN